MRARACNFKTSNAAIFSVISGRRYYNPALGRWVNRDPIREEGGAHVYCCCNVPSKGCPYTLCGVLKKTPTVR